MASRIVQLCSLLIFVSISGSNGDEVSLMQTTMEQHLPSTMGSKGQAAATNHNPATDSKQSLAQVTPATLNFEWPKAVAEYVAMTLFVIIGCGSAMAIAKEEGSAWVLQVALAFGFAITSLAYSIGQYSGGQINCAVTFALWVHGDMHFLQALGNLIAQLLGSITGAIILCLIFPAKMDKTGSLGSNAIADGFGAFGVLVGEFLMTFLLVLVVFESGHADDASKAIATICIGLAVFLAHCVLIPLDGCSINPTRSFGPALISTFRNGEASAMRDMWVFWVGPLLGALGATGVHSLFQLS